MRRIIGISLTFKKNWQSLTYLLLLGSAGVAVFVGIPAFEHQKKNAAMLAVPTSTPLPNSPSPEKIIIERYNLNLAVKEATISANDWQIYEDAVSWLKNSGNLDGGNIILYGHNAKTVFGKIIQLRKGDVITLNSLTKAKRYKVVRAFQTTRNDLKEINKNTDQLTMYTCSGWFDKNRYFVIALPED